MIDLDAVYTILVEECGATLSGREAFWAVAARFKRLEYRFIGALGFGGKVWLSEGRREAYVTCYREDETPERMEMIARANRRLAELVRSTYQEQS